MIIQTTKRTSAWQFRQPPTKRSCLRADMRPRQNTVAKVKAMFTTYATRVNAKEVFASLLVFEAHCTITKLTAANSRQYEIIVQLYVYVLILYCLSNRDALKQLSGTTIGSVIIQVM